MISALSVARRELQVTLRAPIVYLVGGLFLVVQGIAFASLVNAMSDPVRPAPLGVLLEGQLSGTLLTWVLELVVLTLLGMRAIADERRAGGWELLLTARVSERAAVVGKWLAACLVYAILWLPTLAYFAIVSAYRSDAGGWDVATIAAGYLGAIAIGAALLAWAIAASAAMSTTLEAGALGFAMLIGLFLVGELPAVWPGVGVDHPHLAAVLEAVSLRRTASGFARGEVTVAAIARIAGLALTGLSVAVAFACAGRRRAPEMRARWLASALVALVSVLGAVAASRHPVRWDVSADGRSTLDPGTREVLAGLPSRASITIVDPTVGGLAPIYDEVERVVERMAEVAPLDVRRVDPVSVPGGLDAIARTGGLALGDLQSNGAVVVELDGRRTVVDRVALATFESATAGFSRLAIEQAISGALARLATPVPIAACATTGHGELPLEAGGDGAKASDGADWRIVADRLRAEGMTVETIDLVAQPAALDRCDVVLVAGPLRPVAPDEALALQAYVARGGGLLVAAAGRPAMAGELANTGIEGLLAENGLGLPHAIAVDATLSVRELPGALLVSTGYTTHPIDRGFQGERATLWYPPRVVVVSDGATPLVAATGASWGERDLAHPPVENDDDIAGPSVLAAASIVRRVVAVGSAESFATAVLANGGSAGDLWLAHVVRWLAGKPEPTVDVAARTPAEVRLVMTTAQRDTVIGLVVAGLPLLWVFAGGAFVYWRRRRALAARGGVAP